MTELLEFLVRALVEDPEAVEVEELEEDGDLIYEISVAESDLGRVIGKGGRVANAIRTVAKAAAVRLDRRVVVDILDEVVGEGTGCPSRLLGFSPRTLEAVRGRSWGEKQDAAAREGHPVPSYPKAE